MRVDPAEPKRFVPKTKSDRAKFILQPGRCEYADNLGRLVREDHPKSQSYGAKYAEISSIRCVG